jgi:YegS/Rv2252/BmrU family lipid kinase
MTDARRVLAIVNRQAGNMQAAACDFIAELRARGFEVATVEPQTSDDACRAIREEAHRIVGVVIGGGDGSISSALPALLETGLPLGVIPLGTANDFARSLGLESSIDRACAAIDAGKLREVDVGEVNGRPFLNAVAIGMPAQAAAELTSKLKRRLGMFATVALIPKLLRRTRAFRFEIDDGADVLRQSGIALLIGNGRYRGGIPVVYDGVDDGMLHAIACRARSVWELASVVFSALLRRLPEDWNVLERSAAHFVVTTSRPMEISVDGDIAGRTPLDLKVLPGALRVFVP